jgi:hypothetical protein
MEMPTEDTPAEAYLPRSAYTISRVAAGAPRPPISKAPSPRATRS